MTSEVSFRRFLSSSSAAIVVRATAAACSFLMSVMVTRVLGAHEAGLFFLGHTVLIIMAMVARLGLDNAIVRFVSTLYDQGKRAAVNGVVIKTLCLTSLMALLIASSTYFASGWIAETLLNQPEFKPVLRMVAICLFPFSCYQLLSFAVQGRNQAVWAMIINATVFPLLLLIATVFPRALDIDSAFNLMMVAVIVSFANAGLAISVWVANADRVIDHSFVPWNEILATAFPMLCISAVSYAVTWTPQLVLAGYADADQIAFYSVSQKTAAMVVLLSIPINSVASPTFAALYTRNKLVELRQFVLRVNAIILAVAVPVLALLFVFAPQVLGLFGVQFEQSKWVLRTMLIGQLFSVVTGSAFFLMMMTGHERLVRNLTALSAGVGVAIAFALIPDGGAIGAAVAGASSWALFNILVWVAVYRTLQINVLRPEIRFLVRSALQPMRWGRP